MPLPVAGEPAASSPVVSMGLVAAPDAVSAFVCRAGLWWLVAALALIALLVGVVVWQKVTGMQEMLARQSADAQANSAEAHALAKQAVSLAQETAARAAVLDSRLSEVALQRGQLDDLIQSMSRSRDENLVVDIDSALRLAQQQAQLIGA